MAAPLVLGTLVVVFTTFIYLLNKPTSVLDIGLATQGRRLGFQSTLTLSDTSIVSSVAASHSSQTNTLQFLIEGAPLTVTFPSTLYASASAVASFLQTRLRTVSTNFTVTASSGKLTISTSPATLFGFAPGANARILELLGFVPPPAYVTSLAATYATALRIFDFSATYRLSMGDTIVISVPTSMTINLITDGAYEVVADGKKLFTPHEVTFETFRLQAYTSQTLRLGLGGRNTESTAGYYTAERYLYTASTTFTKPSNTVSIYAEVVGAGGSSLANDVYGGAGACVSGYLSTLPSTLTVTVGTASGSFSRLVGTGIDIIAGGGGMGGTRASTKRPPTGGSAGLHGSNGFPIFLDDTRLGTYSSILNTGGRGGTNTQGGLSGLGTDIHGGSLSGAAPDDFAAGGSGHFGGGAGGQRTIQGRLYSGGGGGGSSLVRGLIHAHIPRPKNEQLQPETSKVKFDGAFGNGGTLTDAFGPGHVALIVTRLAGV